MRIALPSASHDNHDVREREARSARDLDDASSRLRIAGSPFHHTQPSQHRQSPTCMGRDCCRRHPRACLPSLTRKRDAFRVAEAPLIESNRRFDGGDAESFRECAAGDDKWRHQAQADTAILTVASSDLLRPAAWRAFYCRFAAAGSVYLGAATSPPCSACRWTFVRLTQRMGDADSRRDSWGRFIIAGLHTVWQVASRQVTAEWFVFTRVNMQWLVDPRLLLRQVQSLGGPSARPAAFVPDTENYWGVNDRFAILNAAAAPAYFGRAASLPAHTGNTESLLAASLKAANASVFLLPTLGTMACCANTNRGECFTRVCREIFVNDTTSSGSPNGITLRVKYIFEAQAAVQNAELLLRRRSSLARCPVGGSGDGVGKQGGESEGEGGFPDCVQPKNAQAPHHCVPMHAVCLRPQPDILWRAIWRRNSTDWFRWLSEPPWRSASLD